jgi:hypothetical protein
MDRKNVNDLLAFLAVAKERSFTKDAAKFGVSQSAFETVADALEDTGFREIKRCAYQASDDPMLRIDHVSSYAGANVDGHYYSLFVEAVARTVSRERH